MKRDTSPPAPDGTPAQEEASSAAICRQAEPEPEQPAGRDDQASFLHGPRLGPYARLRKGRPSLAGYGARRQSAKAMAADGMPAEQKPDAPQARPQGQDRPQKRSKPSYRCAHNFRGSSVWL